MRKNSPSHNSEEVVVVPLQELNTDEQLSACHQIHAYQVRNTYKEIDYSQSPKKKSFLGKYHSSDELLEMVNNDEVSEVIVAFNQKLKKVVGFCIGTSREMCKEITTFNQFHDAVEQNETFQGSLKSNDYSEYEWYTPQAFVNPDNQGQGLAGKMKTELRNQMKNKTQFSKLLEISTVDVTNTKMNRVYEKKGVLPFLRNFELVAGKVRNVYLTCIEPTTIENHPPVIPQPKIIEKFLGLFDKVFGSANSPKQLLDQASMAYDQEK